MGGVAETIGSLFGAGKSPSVSVPTYEPVPVREAESEPESMAVRESERRKLRARRGMSGTLLTSPLGVAGMSGAAGASGGTVASGLLGRAR